MERHEQLIHGILKQLKAIFEKSEQAIYVYLDDTHKACNKRFSSLLGYKSPAEWAKIDTSLLGTTVAEKSQDTLVGAYQRAMEKMAGSRINVTWKKKSGGTVNTAVILTPMVFEDHLFALHFVSKT
jgi:carbohydrate-binding DOMON domain-containing protein